jgi:broad specificity phosphatase PhoE
MSQNIWITRHGNRLDFIKPEWFNTAARPYDPPLAEDGILQAQALGKRLKEEQISQIFCSPFLRTVQTAFEVAQILSLSIQLEPGLGEWLHPEWMPKMPERTSMAELVAQYPLINSDYQPLILPNYPETEADLMERTGRVSQVLSDRYPDQNILLVSHAVAVQGAAWGLVKGNPMIAAKFCCLIKAVRSPQGWELELAGDTSHLQGI